MKLQFDIEPLNFKTLQVLPDAWSETRYKELLEAMDYGDTSSLNSQEVEEMCLLSIADNEPEEAAKIVLKYIFGEKLNSGQIDNISNEMTTEKLWEEYAELDMHEGFFNATQLLYKAFNGKFPHPEAVSYEVKITSKDKKGMALFNENIEATLLRILAQGMPDNTLLKRLFSDQLEGEEFEDAVDIIWHYKKTDHSENSVSFQIISSSYWLHDLKFTDSFEAVLSLED